LEIFRSENLWPQQSQGSAYPIADSKQIYKGNFARLEKLALTLYISSAGTNRLPPLPIPELEWYQADTACVPPARKEIETQAAQLRRALRGCPLKLSLNVLSERQFNHKIAQWNNKTNVLKELVGRLICDFGGRPGHCAIDHLGALKRYRPWLCQLFGKNESLPQNWEIRNESPHCSEYYDREEQLHLQFRVRGDQQNILCAIASVWAKYHRERFMKQFNQYWQQRFPAAPTTSGYYRDAMIFLDYVKEKMGELPPDIQRNR
ncbi:MAG: hypothetical protein AAF975_08950, partial [Spirochaetota bacterium]